MSSMSPRPMGPTARSTRTACLPGPWRRGTTGSVSTRTARRYGSTRSTASRTSRSCAWAEPTSRWSRPIRITRSSESSRHAVSATARSCTPSTTKGAPRPPPVRADWARRRWRSSTSVSATGFQGQHAPARRLRSRHAARDAARARRRPHVRAALLRGPCLGGQPGHHVLRRTGRAEGLAQPDPRPGPRRLLRHVDSGLSRSRRQRLLDDPPVLPPQCRTGPGRDRLGARSRLSSRRAVRIRRSRRHGGDACSAAQREVSARRLVARLWSRQIRVG